MVPAPLKDSKSKQHQSGKDGSGSGMEEEDEFHHPAPTFDENSIFNPENKFNFESSFLHEQCRGAVLIELYIRSKRRGQWQMTNVTPVKVGKMRKCAMHFLNLLVPIRIEVETSNIEIMKLSPYGRSSTDGVDRITCDLKPFVQSSFSFYIIPMKNRSVAQITASVEFVAPSAMEMTNPSSPNMNATSSPSSWSEDSSSTEEVVKFKFFEWNMSVAGHKFESSKAGKLQSEQNTNARLIYLFNPPLATNTSNTYGEDDLHLIDSLLMLRYGKRDDSNDDHDSPGNNEDKPAVNNSQNAC